MSLYNAVFSRSCQGTLSSSRYLTWAHAQTSDTMYFVAVMHRVTVNRPTSNQNHHMLPCILRVNTHPHNHTACLHIQVSNHGFLKHQVNHEKKGLYWYSQEAAGGAE